MVPSGESKTFCDCFAESKTRGIETLACDKKTLTRRKKNASDMILAISIKKTGVTVRKQRLGKKIKVTLRKQRLR